MAETSNEASSLRALIRSGALSGEAYEKVVERIYELERQQEALDELVKLSEEMGLYEITSKS